MKSKRSLESLKSVQSVFQHPLMAGINRLAIFRCKRRSKSYERNLEWLARGLTGWWNVSDEQQFDGIVVLIDSEKSKFVEVWAGRADDPSLGRYEREPNERRWSLQVNGAFRFLGVMQGPIGKFLGKAFSQKVNYAERRGLARHSTVDRVGNARVLSGTGYGPTPGEPSFSPENATERDVVKPGQYKPDPLHARVVNALYELLTRKGYRRLDNTRGFHDLHGMDENGSSHLFEVKSDSSRSSVYSAIGQLHIYEMVVGKSQKIAVLPGGRMTEEVWRKSLAKLRIQLLTFEEVDGVVRFLEN